MFELNEWLTLHGLSKALVKVTEFESEDGTPALRIQVYAADGSGLYGEFDVIAAS